MTLPRSGLSCLVLCLAVLIGCGGGEKKKDDPKPTKETKQEPAKTAKKPVKPQPPRREPNNLTLPPKPPAGADASATAYIPATADVASVGGVQSFLESPFAQLIPLEMITVESRRNMGFDLLDIQRLTSWADYQLPDLESPKTAGAILTLAEPTIKSKVIGATSAEVESEVDGETMYFAPKLNLYFALPSQQTIVVSPNVAGLAAMLQANGAQSRLIEELKLAPTDAKSQFAVISIEGWRPELTAMSEQLPPLPPQLGNVRKLHELLDVIRLTISESANQTYTVEMICPDDKSAVELNTLIENGMNMAQGMFVGQMSEEINPEDPVQTAIVDYYKRILPVVQEALTPKVQGNQLSIQLESELDVKTIGISGGVLLAAAAQQVRHAAIRIANANKLKQIVLALHNYESVHGKLPDNIKDKDGKPLLSWRVRLLPQLEAGYLQDQIRLDEPWDSPHNKQFHDVPYVYANEYYPKANAKGLTGFLAVIHDGTVYGAKMLPSLGQIGGGDGNSNTIAFVEAPESEAVPWMKPVDLPVDPQAPLKKLLPEGRDGFNVAFMDGSVRYITSTIDPEIFARLLTWNGGEPPAELD